MKITYLRATLAEIALGSLKKEQLPYKTAAALRRLARALEPAVRAFSEEEHALMEQYGEKDENGNVRTKGGTWRLADPERAADYAADRRESENTEMCINWEPVTLPPAEGLKLSIEQLDALDGLIGWEEG